MNLPQQFPNNNVQQPSNLYKKPKILLILTLLTIVVISLTIYLLIQNKKLSLIPPKPSPIPTPSSMQSRYNPNLQIGPFHCPSTPSFCSSGTYKESTVAGKLPKGAPIYAAFAGTIGSPPFPPEGMTLIILGNETRGLQGIYALKNPIVTKAKIAQEGEIIATASGEPLPPQFEGNSFSFNLTKVLNVSWEQYPISKKSFK